MISESGRDVHHAAAVGHEPHHGPFGYRLSMKAQAPRRVAKPPTGKEPGKCAVYNPQMGWRRNATAALVCECHLQGDPGILAVKAHLASGPAALSTDQGYLLHNRPQQPDHHLLSRAVLQASISNRARQPEFQGVHHQVASASAYLIAGIVGWGWPCPPCWQSLPPFELTIPALWERPIALVEARLFWQRIWQPIHGAVLAPDLRARLRYRPFGPGLRQQASVTAGAQQIEDGRHYPPALRQQRQLRALGRQSGRGRRLLDQLTLRVGRSEWAPRALGARLLGHSLPPQVDEHQFKPTNPHLLDTFLQLQSFLTLGAVV